VSKPKKETTKGKYNYLLFLSIGFSGAVRSDVLCISDLGSEEAEWDNLSEKARHKILDEYLQDWKIRLIDCGWEAID